MFRCTAGTLRRRWKVGGEHTGAEFTLWPWWWKALASKRRQSSASTDTFCVVIYDCYNLQKSSFTVFSVLGGLCKSSLIGCLRESIKTKIMNRLTAEFCLTVDAFKPAAPPSPPLLVGWLKTRDLTHHVFRVAFDFILFSFFVCVSVWFNLFAFRASFKQQQVSRFWAVVPSSYGVYTVGSTCRF